MIQPLYRPEVSAPRSRALTGEVIVHTRLSSWVITGLLLAAACLGAAILFFGRVETAEGAISLFEWLTTR